MSQFFSGIYNPGTFFLSLCQTWQFAGSLENFSEVPQFEKGERNLHFLSKISSNFSRLLLCRIVKTLMEPITVSKFEELLERLLWFFKFEELILD
jgi:hypothetical protein